MMLKKFLGYRCSTATLSDNDKLVLSLENALTPAMWVIDLNESPSILFKVVETEDGLYALQKLVESTKGRSSEDLAFYNKKAHAMNAMEQASLAMSKTRSNKPPTGFMRFIKLAFNILAVLIVVLTISLYLRLDVKLANWLNDAPQTNNTNQISTDNSFDMPIVQPSSNPDAVGVPLSADDFFNTQPSGRPSGLPF